MEYADELLKLSVQGRNFLKKIRKTTQEHSSIGGSSPFPTISLLNQGWRLWMIRFAHNVGVEELLAVRLSYVTEDFRSHKDGINALE